MLVFPSEVNFAYNLHLRPWAYQMSFDKGSWFPAERHRIQRGTLPALPSHLLSSPTQDDLGIFPTVDWMALLLLELSLPLSLCVRVYKKKMIFAFVWSVFHTAWYSWKPSRLLQYHKFPTLNNILFYEHTCFGLFTLLWQTSGFVPDLGCHLENRSTALLYRRYNILPSHFVKTCSSISFNICIFPLPSPLIFHFSLL